MRSPIISLASAMRGLLLSRSVYEYATRGSLCQHLRPLFGLFRGFVSICRRDRLPSGYHPRSRPPACPWLVHHMCMAASRAGAALRVRCPRPSRWTSQASIQGCAERKGARVALSDPRSQGGEVVFPRVPAISALEISPQSASAAGPTRPGNHESSRES